MKTKGEYLQPDFNTMCNFEIVTTLNHTHTRARAFYCYELLISLREASTVTTVKVTQLLIEIHKIEFS